jgi:hypothetical protein
MGDVVTSNFQINVVVDGLIDENGQIILKVCSLHRAQCADPAKLSAQSHLINRALAAYRATLALAAQEPAPVVRQPAPVAVFRPAPVVVGAAPKAPKLGPLAQGLFAVVPSTLVPATRVPVIKTEAEMAPSFKLLDEEESDDDGSDKMDVDLAPSPPHGSEDSTDRDLRHLMQNYSFKEKK